MIKRVSYLLFSLSIFALYKVNFALAQAEDIGIDALDSVNLGRAELTDTIAQLINVFLGFLGVITVILIIYGGWMWMTSQGSAEKVQKAKLILTSAVIGLVIILSAYAIARFVLSNIYDATYGDPVIIIPDDPPPFTPSCGVPLDPNTVKVCTIKPDNTGGPAGQYITIEGWNFDAYGANSQVVFDGPENAVAELVSCGGVPRWEWAFASGAHSYYRVKVIIPDIILGNYKVEIHADDGSNGNYPSDPLSYFEVRAGEPGPGIACIVPNEQFRNLRVDIEGVNFGDIDDIITMSGWDSASEEVISIDFSDWTHWSDTSIGGAKIPETALAGDLTVTVGALTSGPEYLKVFCNDSILDCASGCCAGHACVDNAICLAYSGVDEGPFIESLSPNAGAEGNIITIYGSNFGDLPGRVYFEDFDGNGIVANLDISLLNPSCSSLWTEQEILVEVPLGVKDNNAKVWIVTNESEESNAKFYDDSVGPLPGICLADPNHGAFGEQVVLHGIKFSAGDKASFGGIVDHNTNIVSDLKAITKVPNVSPDETGVWLKTVASLLSNALPFTVDAVAGGDPVIHEVSPNLGPKGQYLTVSGANFGNTQGQLNFINIDSTPGDFDFPPQCSDSYWQDDSIVVKVPNIPDDAYKIQVKRNIDGKESNLYDFTVELGTPGPGLCALQPDNGPANGLFGVSLYGDNFGADLDQVFFFDSKLAGINFWEDNHISARTPNGAVTGPVVVKQSGQTSNALNFAVGSCSIDGDCSAGDECCTQDTGNYCALAGSCPGSNACTYTWTVTTAAAPFALQEDYLCENNLQSPSPWPDAVRGEESRDAYLDTNIVGLFTRDAEDADFSTDNIKVSLCNVGGEFNNMSCGADLAGTVSIINHNSDNEGFVFNPEFDLDPNTWYRVELDIFHSEIGGDVWDGNNFSWSDGTSGKWHFRTQDALCEVSDIQVTPNMSPAADVYVGHTRDFYATPIGDNCNMCGSEYNWDLWDLPDGHDAGKADIVYQNILNTNISQARLKGLQVTENDPANPVVELLAGLDGFHDQVKPKIKDAILDVIDYGPDCTESCMNALVWATFNTDINPATLDRSYLQIYECTDESCTSLAGGNLTTHLTLSDPQTVIAHHANFDIDTHYKVFVKEDGIKNILGYGLANDYTWDFATSDGLECQADRVEVSPANKLSTIWNEVINYTAIPYSAVNSCAVDGQALDPSVYDWSWDINAPVVASLADHGTYEAVVTTLSNGIANIKAVITAAPAYDPASVGLPGTAILEVNQAPEVFYDAPKVTDNSPTTPACINSAMRVRFNMLMDNVSLDSGIELYEKSLVAGPGCVPSGGIHVWCPVDGDLSTHVSSDQTVATYYPNDLLQKNHDYLAIVHETVQSTRGINLDPLIYNIDFDDDGNLDAYYWPFTTHDQICQVSFVTVDPHPDLFTCSRSNCPDDINGGLAGNQHQFTATAYDTEGEVLNMSTYQWTENNNLLDLVSETGDSIQATASNDNGITHLIVEASDPMSGSAVGQSLVTLALCENPWPSDPTNFPYNFDSSPYNFSTHYCQDSGVGGETILPYLQDPIIKGPDGGLTLEEFIFVVDPAITAITNPNLAKETESWWKRLFGSFKNKVLAIPAPPDAPTNLEMVANSSEGVVLNWQDNADDEEGFKVYRKSSTVDWIEIAEVSAAAANPVEFTDTSIITGEVYSYRVIAYKFGVNGSSDYSNTVTVTAAASAIDVIGVRVMSNAGHLSVQDWYSKYAPNPGANGQLLEVDGYEALLVGNTAYIGAANVSGAIYTNIYIISHSVGARASTQTIFNNMLLNMRLSINIVSPNVCLDDPERSCQSKFDCADLDIVTCRADELKLRRDTKRLADLVGIKNELDIYGQLYKACDNNSSISCTDNSQCPIGGECVPYYPLLNAGTYINGMSVSKWPSWQQEFSQVLSTVLPPDPINRFTGCPENTDPDTCWDELHSAFYCPAGSLIYLYKKEAAVDSYSLDANFEFDYGGIQFRNSLTPTVDVRIRFDNDTYCQDASLIGDPAATTGCGNGIVDLDGLDDILGNEDDEECDGGFRNLCDATINNEDWWNEQLGGCYPPGTLDEFGNLIECTWYEPESDLTPAQCGNFCGDAIIQADYELCEPEPFGDDNGNGVYDVGEPFSDSNGNGIWDNDFGGILYTCGDSSIPSCGSCMPVCDDGALATACGDGFWDAAAGEQCDSSADPDGLAGWSCTEGGIILCDTCQRECTVGDPYDGSCNDGNIDDPAEECEPMSYVAPDTPAESSAVWQYACGAVAGPEACMFTGGWCGNGQPANGTFGEECDWWLYPVPTPAQSHVDWQYSCDSTNCVFESGYCGNGNLDPGFEECDWDGYVLPTPAASHADNQYACGNNASGVNACQYIGGYCGDGDINGPEQCEGATASCVEAGFIAGAATCTACSIDNTAACCDINALNAKFMADDDYELFVNGTSIGTGSNWEECGEGGDDNHGACEFHLDIDLTTDRNVIAFHAWDTAGGQQGVIGSFSCQSLSCQSICYKGADAGNMCSDNGDCDGDPADPNDNGTCIHPGVAEDKACSYNVNCGFDNIDTPGNERWHDGADPGGDWEHKPSLCLPGDYGIVTNTTGLWTCTNVAPGGDWNSDPDYPDAGWSNVHVSDPGGAWDNPNHPSYWKHMVPGADIIWVVPDGTDTEVWCRYVIDPS